jgi:predicted 3-demethylubiquinone-9 3-methyltransferase (glyoxalase superfamily)
VKQRIQPCLWFDSQADEAARYYGDIFRNSRILRITRYGKAGHEIHGRPEGSVLTVEFELDGQKFTALNGGPAFKFNEAVSFEIFCETQAEIDYYWDKLTVGGDPNAQQCCHRSTWRVQNHRRGSSNCARIPSERSTVTSHAEARPPSSSAGHRPPARSGDRSAM